MSTRWKTAVAYSSIFQVRQQRQRRTGLTNRLWWWVQSRAENRPVEDTFLVSTWNGCRHFDGKRGADFPYHWMYTHREITFVCTPFQNVYGRRCIPPNFYSSRFTYVYIYTLRRADCDFVPLQRRQVLAVLFRFQPTEFAPRTRARYKLPFCTAGIVILLYTYVHKQKHRCPKGGEHLPLMDFKFNFINFIFYYRFKYFIAILT